MSGADKRQISPYLRKVKPTENMMQWGALNVSTEWDIFSEAKSSENMKKRGAWNIVGKKGLFSRSDVKEKYTHTSTA